MIDFVVLSVAAGMAIGIFVCGLVVGYPFGFSDGKAKGADAVSAKLSNALAKLRQFAWIEKTGDFSGGWNEALDALEREGHQ